MSKDLKLRINFNSNPRYLLTGEYFERAAKRIGIEIDDESSDLVLNIQGREPFPYTRGKVTANYGIDVLHNSFLLPGHYDVYFATHEPQTKPLTRWEVIPHGFDPELCDLNTKKEYDVVLSGRTDVHNYNKRAYIYGVLMEHFNCLIVPNHTPSEDYLKELSRAKFIVNVSGWGEINRRVYDGMALGVSLIDNNDYLHLVGEPGVHFLTFENEDDIVQTVKSYLDDEDKYNRVREAGRAHAYANHTYDARLQKIYDVLKEVYHELYSSSQEGSTPH